MALRSHCQVRKKILKLITAKLVTFLNGDPNKSININLKNVNRGKTDKVRSLTDLTKQLSQEIESFGGDDMDLEEQFYDAMVNPKDIEKVSKVSDKNTYVENVQALKEIAKEDCSCRNFPTR